jgi:hypothetical protein
MDQQGKIILENCTCPRGNKMINKHTQTIKQKRPTFTAFISLLFLTALGFADTRHEIVFPDIPGYTTLKCDFHTHTVFSDGNVWPDVRVKEAWREGLDAISITDHVEYQPHKEDIPKNLNRPFEIADQKAANLGILLVKGAEMSFPTPPGHFNALFVQDVNALEAKEFPDEMKNAHQQDGFVFWNHPAWQGREKGRWTDLDTTLVKDGLLHGIEICNGDDYDSLAHQWCLEKDLTMVGGTDIHDPSLRLANTDKDHRTLTLVFAKERSLAAVKEALQDGRTAVWCKDKLIGKKEFLEPLFYASITMQKLHKTNKNLRVNISNHSEITLTLERTGSDGPKEIILPAKETVRLTMPEQKEAFLYTVNNFLVAPKEGLPVRIEIPTISTPEKSPSIKD